MQIPARVSDTLYNNDKPRRSSFRRRHFFPAFANSRPSAWKLIKLGIVTLLFVVVFAWSFTVLPGGDDGYGGSSSSSSSWGQRVGSKLQQHVSGGGRNGGGPRVPVERQRRDPIIVRNNEEEANPKREREISIRRGMFRGLGAVRTKPVTSWDEGKKRVVSDSDKQAPPAIEVNRDAISLEQDSADGRRDGDTWRAVIKNDSSAVLGVTRGAEAAADAAANLAETIEPGGKSGAWNTWEGIKQDARKAFDGAHELYTGKGLRRSQAMKVDSYRHQWQIRQKAVVTAFEHAWRGYKEFAWGYDELAPLTRIGLDGLGSVGATILDGLDTAMIMGLNEVVMEAGGWVEREFEGKVKGGQDVNVFESTIRLLGGLLSAFYLRSEGYTTTGPEAGVYLERATMLGEKLMGAFTDSSTKVPLSDVNLATGRGSPAKFDSGWSSTAEATTLGLELWYLSKVTGDARYGDAAMELMRHIETLEKTDGLVPIFINPWTGHFQGENIRLGSRGDSYYEYLVKMWMQQGGARPGGDQVQWLRNMFDEAMQGVKTRLISRSRPNGLAYVAELPAGPHGGLHPKMDHLVCFLPGAMALGATRGMTVKQARSSGLLTPRDLEDLAMAEELTHTCFEMYNVTETGLAPEIAHFNTQPLVEEGGVVGVGHGDGGTRRDAFYGKDVNIHRLDRHNLLRPETVESLFYMYRITGMEKYREWGWKIFQAFERHARVESGGYSSLQDVTVVPAPRRDKMETFFLGETLKYLYLLFGDSNVLPLDAVVFNTEAHPLPVMPLINNHGAVRQL